MLLPSINTTQAMKVSISMAITCVAAITVIMFLILMRIAPAPFIICGSMEFMPECPQTQPQAQAQAIFLRMLLW